MITLALIFGAIGFYCGYQTSDRAVFNRSLQWEVWLHQRKTRSSVIGVFFLCLSLLVSAFHLGVLAGVLLFIVLLSIVASLIILFAPLRLFSYRSVLVIFLISLLLELTC